jgi:hypothetical protein
MKGPSQSRSSNVEDAALLSITRRILETIVPAP